LDVSVRISFERPAEFSRNEEQNQNADRDTARQRLELPQHVSGVTESK
jgi:hypothetical protein